MLGLFSVWSSCLSFQQLLSVVVYRCCHGYKLLFGDGCSLMSLMYGRYLHWMASWVAQRMFRATDLWANTQTICASVCKQSRLCMQIQCAFLFEYS